MFCSPWGHKELDTTEWLNWPELIMCILSGTLYMLSCVQLFPTPWTVAHQAPLSMGFSRQDYWSGLPFPSPGDLPDAGIEPGSPTLQADSFLSEPTILKIHWQKYERTYICTRLCKAALFITAKEWKQAQMFSDRELTEWTGVINKNGLFMQLWDKNEEYYM